MLSRAPELVAIISQTEPINTTVPTATTSMAYLPAGEVEVIKVSPGEKMAAIRTSGDGTLYCTELSA